jgi:negative regulator of sigma E activity
MNGAEDMNKQQERVSAWLDGAMTPEEAAAFEQEMEGNPELAKLAERWQGNDVRLRAAFAAPEAGAISEELLGRLGLADEQLADNVVALDRFRVQREAAHNDNAPSPKWRWPLVGSIAASFIVAVAVGSFWLGGTSGIEGQQAFQTAMNDTNSGVAVDLGVSQTLTPVLSFEAGDGRFCREFAVEGGAASSQGIACKSGEQWKVEALVKGGGALPSNTEIRTAGGKDGVSLDAVYSRLNASDPLGAEKEKSIILNGWKKN